MLAQRRRPATPYDAVERWNDTDSTTEWPPTGVTTYDWVTSKGFLTRAAAFDEVGGTGPAVLAAQPRRQGVLHAPALPRLGRRAGAGGTVRHGGGQSAPSPFRAFLAHWREPWLNQRWSPTVAALAGRTSAAVAHPARTGGTAASPLAAAIGAEASRMVVPLSRELAEETRTAAHWHRVREEAGPAGRALPQAWQDTNAHAEP